MDVNQLLKNTISPDNDTRSNAEQQLSTAAEADFSGYLRTLAQELANDQAEQDVRMAAGLALKNSFSAREFARRKEVQSRWKQQLDPELKDSVKQQALKALTADDVRAGMQAAQFVASIAAIELPLNQWPNLMPMLVQNVTEGSDNQKQTSLATIGYICDIQDPELQSSLGHYSNTILTAVVQGARKEEPNMDVRERAMSALAECLDFVRSNFENEGERNFIMQVVCEATQADDERVMQAAYGCLNRIMTLYYEKMYFYMEKALFGLTIQGMKNEEEDVAKLAIEFWCSVCEEEISIEDDNATMEAEGGGQARPYYNFAKIATNEVIPVLLDLLTKQDEDAAEDEYNVHMASYQCLQLWAQTVGNTIVTPVLTFVEQNLRSDDWHFRDAAVSAFGAIMEGPDENTLETIVTQGLAALVNMMSDPVVQVRDSTAFTLGRISECVASAIGPSSLEPLVSSLFNGLASNPRMASSCCWALMNLAERFAGEPGCQENPMTPHFDNSITALVQTTERMDGDNTVRTAAYEVLNTFVANAGMKSIHTVANLSGVILQRLEESIPLRQQVVSVEDRLKLDEIQTSLSSVVMAIIQRLDAEIKPQADRIMQALIQTLDSLNNKSSVADTVFAAVGALATALEDDFQKYMSSFTPYLFNALNNQEEPALCAMAIGLVSDITRSLGPLAQPYCNDFMNSLLENLRSTALANQFKPAILQCFGDIAQSIGGAFEMYLGVVAQVLDQAASIKTDQMPSYEILDYIVSLREGIMDAWAGTIIAMKSDNKSQLLKPYVPSIFNLLRLVENDNSNSEALLRSTMGVIGDLADAFPPGELRDLYGQEFVASLIKDTKSNRDFSSRTLETARWAREQTKRQTGGAGGTTSSFPVA